MPVGGARAGILGGGVTIPDTQVSRPADDNTTTDSGAFGVRITTNVRWPDIGATISSNTSGLGSGATGYVYRVSDATLLGSTSLAGLSAGDSFVVPGVNLKPYDSTLSTTYNIVLDNGGPVYTSGYHTNFATDDTPVTSTDGNLTIVDGAQGATGTVDGGNNIVTVGNVGFS